ncbi:MAG: DUF115 domain-containing protein [Opitutae bacterium]|nr:DUF115 domain-containing protein [Opitutae bacterium]
MKPETAAGEELKSFVQEYPGATTCVVIGAVQPEWREQLSRARAVLWCADERDCAAGAPAVAGERMHFFPLAGASLAQWSEALVRFVRLDARRLPSVFVAAAEADDDERRRAPFVAVVVDELREQHRGRVTRQQDGFRWQQHVLANLSRYTRRPLPSEWRGALAGLPAAVCGAGPSLDLSAPRLGAGQEGCVVFAADSALRTLARHGVRVDFAVSIDVAKLPEKCLPETGELPGRVVLSAVSPAGWSERVGKERVHFVSSRQITTDWLAKSGVPAPALASAENCGVTALELARWLGCAPIFLFGLDLALSGRQRHTGAADASIYVRSGFDAAQEFSKVPGNWEERVSTHAPGDWRALNARLASFPAGSVFNVNDRGARLENATPVRPDAWTPPEACAKAERLALLARGGADAPAPAAATAALAELRACGRRLLATTPELRRALAARGPEAVAVALRPVLADPAFGRALGGFALKLMPHLLPPTEGDADFWRGLLDEFEALAIALESVG